MVNGLFDQLLKSGQDLLNKQQAGGQGAGPAGGGGALDALGGLFGKDQGGVWRWWGNGRPGWPLQ